MNNTLLIQKTLRLHPTGTLSRQQQQEKTKMLEIAFRPVAANGASAGRTLCKFKSITFYSYSSLLSYKLFRCLRARESARATYEKMFKNGDDDNALKYARIDPKF